MKKQALASYSGKPGIVRLPSIESANHTIPICGKINSRSYSLSNPINENNKSLLPPKSKTINQSNQKNPIDQQMMSTIRVDIEKMIEISESFIQYNHSALIKQVQLHENLVKLHELFLPFLRDALSFFTSPNSFFDEDKTFITSSSMRASSFSFLQQWKSVLSILDSIDDNGISSLQDFINEKFNIIFKGIEAVATKPEKHTVLYETIGKSTTILNTSATNLHKLITQLIENFADPTSESVSYYYSEIKQFLSLYNESYYNVFPKAGFLPYELANLKSDTLTASNELMSSLRALFSFWPDFKELDIYKEEIQKLLNSAICQMRLPSSLVRLIAHTPKKKVNQEREALKKVRPEFTKLESFISSVLKTIEKPPLDPKIDLWKRLKIVENMIVESIQNLNDTISKIVGQSRNLQTLLIEADSRKKQLERLRSENSELFELNQNLQNQLEEMTKLAEKRKDKIELLRNNAERLQEKQTIEKVSTKLNEMMNKIDPSLTKIDHEENESDFTSLEKLNIFVLEKKCNTCRLYEKERREIMKILSPLISVNQGESLLSLIQSFVKRQEALEVENARISSLYEEKKLQLEKIEEATQSMLSKSGSDQSKRLGQKGQGPGSVSSILMESFNNIEDIHKSDMKAMKTEMKESHARELGKIAEMFDGIISDDDTKSGKISSNPSKSGIDFDTKSRSNELFAKSARGRNRNPSSLYESANGINDNGCDDGHFNSENDQVDDDENEFKSIVMSKVKKAASKIESLQHEVDKNNELMEKVKKWMKKHAEGIDVDHLDFDQSLTTLMNAIDKRGNPLQSKVDRLEKESQKATSECKKLVEKLCEMKRAETPASTAKMSVIDLIKIAEEESINMNNKLQRAQSKVDSHDHEIETARNQMMTIAERLHNLLQIEGDADFEKMDLNTLLKEITGYVTGLISGGTKRLFLAVSELNDMAKLAKKYSKFPNSTDPKVYLPDIFDRCAEDSETIRAIKMFENPLKDIFDNFDFKKQSFDPNKESFKFLREKIFQLHLILGNDNNVISDEKVLNIMKRFISLSSALFSNIASSFLEGQEREPTPKNDNT